MDDRRPRCSQRSATPTKELEIDSHPPDSPCDKRSSHSYISKSGKAIRDRIGSQTSEDPSAWLLSDTFAELRRSYRLHMRFRYSSSFEHGSQERRRGWSLEHSDQDPLGKIGFSWNDDCRRHRKAMVPVEALRPIAPRGSIKHEPDQQAVVIAGNNTGRIVRVRKRRAEVFRVADIDNFKEWDEKADNLCRIEPHVM